MGTITTMSAEESAPSRFDQVKEQFKKIFDAVDKDASGAIDKAEIKGAITKIAAAVGAGEGGPSPEEVDAMIAEMFSQIDIDGDGTIDFDELLLAFRNAPGMPENLEGELDGKPEEEFNQGFSMITALADCFVSGDFAPFPA